MYIIDASATNSVILHKIKYSENYEKNSHRTRRLALENLALELIKPCIKWRVNQREKNHFQGVQKSIQNAIIKTEETLISKVLPPSNNIKMESRKYCGFCVGDGRLKSKNACLKCQVAICNSKHTYSYCPSCNLELNKK